MSIIEEVARSLGIEPKALERAALKLWLHRKLRLIGSEITEILGRYSVDGMEDLADKIRRGEVLEHPAWEDLVVLENLMNEKRKIEEALKHLGE